jgi:hypothetical protein
MGAAAKGEAQSGVPAKLDPEWVPDPEGGPPAGAVARRGPPNGESVGPVSEKGEGAGACMDWIPGVLNARLPGGPRLVGAADECESRYEVSIHSN